VLRAALLISVFSPVVRSAAWLISLPNGGNPASYTADNSVPRVRAFIWAALDGLIPPRSKRSQPSPRVRATATAGRRARVAGRPGVHFDRNPTKMRWILRHSILMICVSPCYIVCLRLSIRSPPRPLDFPIVLHLSISSTYNTPHSPHNRSGCYQNVYLPASVSTNDW
jgi:hypothetical protein